jgi:hypothetical protein
VSHINGAGQDRPAVAVDGNKKAQIDKTRCKKGGTIEIW